MDSSTTQLEENYNLVRVNNGTGSLTANFRKLKFVKSQIIPCTSQQLPNTPIPTQLQIKQVNDFLTTDIEGYCSSFYPYGTNWASATKYICYESNRDVMNAAGASVTYMHAQVDIYEIVKSTNNAF